MSENSNAIQGNQESHQGSVTDTRNESVNNWQGWGARSIIGLLLLALAWYVAAQNFGFFYKILIAGGMWWIVSAAEPKLMQSKQYKEAVWYWPMIVKGMTILMLVLTLLHSGFGQSAKRGVEVLEGQAACLADSGSQACVEYRAAQAALDAPQLARERQAEIDQAAHEAQVALRIAEEMAPTATNQVVNGCDHLAGIQSGLYDFIQGTEGCRHIKLGPNEYYDAVKGATMSGPRCTRWYPSRTGVSYFDRPGPDRMVNKGDAVEEFVVYFLRENERDPIDRNYTCG